MKLNGKRPGIHVEPIVLPRPEGDIVMKAQAVGDFKDFDKLCPPPEPRRKRLADGQEILDVEDKGYKQAVENYSQKRVAYMCIKGLSAGTPDLEWEQVKLEDNNTWLKFEAELIESGFSDVEIKRIVAGVMRANCLSEMAVEEARKRFLAGEQAQNDE